VEFQFVFPAESFLTKGASEGFLPSMNETVSAEVVGLFKRPPTFCTAMLSLNAVRVQVHHWDCLHWEQHRGPRRLRFGKFQFLWPEWFGFNSVGINMICVERNKQILFWTIVVAAVKIDVDTKESGCLTDVPCLLTGEFD